MDSAVDSTLIEKYVRLRRKKRAHLLIQDWLKENPSVDSRIQASDWYRRLGDFTVAYRVVAPEEYRLNRTARTLSESRQLLACAHILNHLGSAGYAMEIVRSLGELKEPDQLRILGNLYLNQFEAEKALPCFEKAERLEKDSESYSARLGKIGTCDALSGCERRDEAIRRLREIKASPEEVLLQGILLQVEGEYLARSGHYKKALNVLEKAEGYFSADDSSLDYGFYLKWLGIAQWGSKRSSGRGTLKKALGVLMNPAHTPEVWLDLFHWMSRLGLENKDQALAIRSYPGLSAGFLKRNQIPSELSLGTRASSEFWIAPRRGEWSLKGQHSLALPKELELLAVIRRAYPYTIPIYRCLSLLWPNEVSSFLFLEPRLNQLVNRLRDKYGLEIRVESKALSMGAQDAKRVAVEVRAQSRAPSLFDSSPSVPLADFREFYGLGRTQAHALIKERVESGEIEQRKSGKAVFLILKEGRKKEDIILD